MHHRCLTPAVLADAALYLVAIACVLAIASAPAFAIPSPELIVGSLTSLSQLGALAAATFGGGAILAGAAGSKSAAAARRAWIAFGVMGVIAAGLLFGLVVNLTGQATERQVRLEANLLRPARQPGQALADATLKELAYRDQLFHPLGITTEAMAARLTTPTAANATLFVDARQDAEIEMGSLDTPNLIRLADLDPQASHLQNKTLLFFCHNGNRSYETCEQMRARGLDCRFMIGGLEKWVVEQRPMTGLTNRTLDQLRAIPDYPNKDRLLDTSEVHDLVATKRAQFVDVRYPGEFERHAISGAINLPRRTLTKAAAEAAVASLPRRPIILPCYDRRSCFYAELMGLELHRAGHDVLGRYTVPFEYFIPSPRPPHVEAFIAERQKSLWQKVREHLASAIAYTAHHWTGLPLTILLLALLSRVIVLPFALKSERDQIVTRATSTELAALKAKLADDPVRLRRALSAFHKTHNLTPLRNLVALAFLPVLALAVTAVADAASAQPTTFLWLSALANPDPLYILPALFALILTGYCIAAFTTTTKQRVITSAIALPLLGATTLWLPAASALYLNASALLLVAQRFYVTNGPARLRAAVTTARHTRILRRLAGARPLALATNLTGIGNKALRLAKMSAAGLPVPPALVLDQAALATFLSAPAKQQTRLAKRFARALGRKALAVRSSAAGEDGTAASFAGVFDSELLVTAADLPASIARVAASFASHRASAYAQNGGHGNVLLQVMAPARYAGVLFTRAPDAPGQMLIELVDGTGDALVSGRTTPKQFRIGRVSGNLIDSTSKPPINLAPLVALGRRIADIFDRPQDIEWAYGNGQFFILQSRDIVADMTDKTVAAEAERLLARVSSAPHGVTLLEQNAMTELLPRPTPLSLDVLNALWSPGGSVDLACRHLGLAYAATEAMPPLYVAAFGRLMLDARLNRSVAPHMTARQQNTLLKRAPLIAQTFRTETLLRLRHEAAVLAAIDPTKLALDDLHAHWRHQVTSYIITIHPEAEIINILAALATSTQPPLDNTADTRPTWHLDALAAQSLPDDARQAAILHLAGHRANLDYELAQPRYAEVPGALDSVSARLSRRPASARPTPGSADDLQLLKEDAKHEVLRFFAIMRRTLLELDRRFALGGHIFQLRLSEIATLSTETASAMQIMARTRRVNTQRLLDHQALPTQTSAIDLELIGVPKPTATPTTSLVVNPNCKGRGTRVAGRADVAGRAYVATAAQAETGAPLPDFRDGDILVTSLIHPDWLDILLRCGGVVAETGAWLSHMAIVAREHDVAMIIGVPNAGQIRTGDRLRLTLDGRVLSDPDAVTRLALVTAK